MFLTIGFPLLDAARPDFNRPHWDLQATMFIQNSIPKTPLLTPPKLGPYPGEGGGGGGVTQSMKFQGAYQGLKRS